MKYELWLAENIKKARISAGLSQINLAKKLGVSGKTVSAYETARAIPPSPALAKISKITNTSLNGIFGIEEDAETELLVKMKSLEQRLEKIEKLLLKSLKK